MSEDTITINSARKQRECNA